MKRATTMTAALAAAFAIGLLGGCMQTEQTATPLKQGKYQGKPDTPPWQNAPVASYGTAKWTAGNEASWEDEIKTRTRAQNEYNRIGQ